MVNFVTGCVKNRRAVSTPLYLLALLTWLFGVETAAADCGTPHDPGRYEATITSGGHDRVYFYYIPSGYTGQAQVPVVFDFHGSDLNANEQLNRSEWERIAERDGFIAVAPQGSIPSKKPGNFSWNIPGVTDGEADEGAYIKDVITSVEQQFCVDDQKFYASGYSGGARMISQYLCDGNTDFASAGFVVGLRAGAPKAEGDGFVPDQSTCKPAKPASLIAFAGQDDKINPISGKGRPYWGYGADAALNRWAELDGCTAPSVDTDGKVEKKEFSCSQGTHIVSYLIAGAGHTWPGSVGFLKAQQFVGKVSFDLDATDLMWQFFSGSKT